MSDQIRRVEYRYVEVDDKPGAGARVFGALEQQGVSLLSMTAFPKSAGKAQIDLVASSGNLETAAAKAGLKLGPKKQAIFVSGQDRPGAVAAIFKKLAEARINVIAGNAACGQSGFGLIVWVKPSDLEAAAKALGV
jgi:predicted amino acid-binding ACT domain protein